MLRSFTPPGFSLSPPEAEEKQLPKQEVKRGVKKNTNIYFSPITNIFDRAAGVHSEPYGVNSILSYSPKPTPPPTASPFPNPLDVPSEQIFAESK